VGQLSLIATYCHVVWPVRIVFIHRTLGCEGDWR
jgi:hypothetical protein